MSYRTVLGALLGLGTSISYYALLSFLPLANHIDGSIYDSYIQLKHQQQHSEKIVIFSIDTIVGGAPQYASVLEDLLNNSQAEVVVINPPQHWYGREANENGRQLRQLIKQYKDRIVLASMTAPIDAEYQTSIALYNYMIEQTPIGGSDTPEIEATEIHGFFEFAYQSGQNGIFDSPASRHSLEGEFIRDDDSKDISLKSVAALALHKLSQRTERDVSVFHSDSPLTSTARIQTPIWNLKAQIHNLSELCGGNKRIGDCKLSNVERFADLSDKFVFFGHTDTQTNAAEVHAMLTPRGEMSAVEVQANHILGLQSGDVYLPLRKWLAIAIVGVGGVCFGIVINTGISGLLAQKKNHWIVRRTLLSISALFLIYALTATSSLAAGVLLPISAPIISWAIAILTSSFVLLYRNQERMVERQLSSERKVVIDQASKQLQSIADRVHQDALHHMKLAMDWLELIQIQSPACDVSVPLEKMLRANQSIRENLIDTRLCAEKLPISSELRLGLHMAIRLHTKRLRKRDELILKVDMNANPIRENSSSRWIEAREGIFSFYRESINNIIRHAQPPKGRSTKVAVDLERVADVAVLRVTNDGGFSSTYLAETTENFGTQVMEKVASRLPNGKFRRRVSAKGDFQVELSWSMNGFM